MSLERTVRAELVDRPLSGGALVERLQARDDPALGDQALAVYAVLENLRARGEVEVAAEGPGERLFGLPGAVRPPPAAPGYPPSFALAAAELAHLEKQVWQLTRGLPPHYFEELRRAVVADADRRAFHGERPRDAAKHALAALGPAAGARRFLRRVERGGPVPLRFAAPRVRWLLVPLVLVGVFVLLRLFVLGIYTLPDDAESMAPALFPAREQGDGLVLVDLLAATFGEPARGEIWVFREAGALFVKRVLGLPGESVAIDHGNVRIDGRLLAKERAELDRVKVVLCGLDGFERGEQGLVPAEPYLADTFRNPDGRLNHGTSVRACADIVVVARVRATRRGGTVTFRIGTGRTEGPHVVVMGEQAFAAVDGREVAAAERLALSPGGVHEIWVTNADGLFRVELDRREVVRAPLERADARADLAVATDGVEIESLELARDLHYRGADRRRLGQDQYYVLGDNSSNSRDSRVIGPVHRLDLVGRAFAVAWPLDRARWLR